MSNNRVRTLVALLLTGALVLTLLPSVYASRPASLPVRAEASAPDVSTYDEDFTTTAYRASGTVSGWGTGTVTSSRDYTVTQLGFYATPNPVTSVDVQGRKAYTVLYDALSSYQTLRIFNVTNSASIEYMGSRSSRILVGVGEVAGDIFYVGTAFSEGSSWLAAYNVTNPYDIPAPLDSLTFSDGNITDLAVQGHFLYVAIHASSGYDFTIVDVADATDVKVVGGSTFSDLYGVDVDGQLAYLAGGIYGLYICNVSIPYAPTMVAQRETSGTSQDVLVEGTLAYLADGPGGVQIIDVSTPSLPVTVGSYDTPGQAQRLALQGHTLFVADGGGGLQVVDVADPTHPCYVTAVALPYTYDVALYGRDVVVGTAGGIYTLRIAKGLAGLAFVGSYAAGSEYWDTRVRGDIAYVAAGPDGLLTFNVSDPAHPVLLDQYVVGPAFYRKLDVQGHLVFVADYGQGFKVFDVRDPSNLKLTYSTSMTYATEVCVAGDVAYVADGTYGVYLFNVSNPYAVTDIKNFDLGPENVTSLCVQGSTLYVGTEASAGKTLLIYDVRDPTSPTQLFSCYPATASLYDVFVDGDLLFAADRDGTVQVWNVTTPSSPAVLAYPFGYAPSGVWGFGPFMLIAAEGWTVGIFNFTNIRAVNMPGSYWGAQASLQVTASGDYAYVANRTSVVILRLFSSAGATYVVGASTAQSLTVDTTNDGIKSATLSYAAWEPDGTSLAWEVSADGGAHWEAVTPSVQHTFAHSASDLRWRATLVSTRNDHSVHLRNLSISYESAEATVTPPPIPGFSLAAITVGLAFGLGLALVIRQRKQRRQ